ncbi:MAG: OBAP family protein [Opitutus sp.]
MNPTIVLGKLLGATCAGLIALPLVAQTSPAGHNSHGDGVASLPAGSPVAAIHAHLCGFHFYSGDMKRSLRVEHYCSHLNPDVFQCVIYDSDQANARLIGIEYIISEALFNGLPSEEKKLWHSHRYEVMSGLLVAPGLSTAAETALMQELVNTYGKTWHLWQVDRGDQLPLGLPKLMMGFTADGQIGAQMVVARDHGQGIDSATVRARRAAMPVRPVATGADGWQKGPAFQIDDAKLQQAPEPGQP